MGNKPYVKAEYPLSEVTGRIIAAAMVVHKGLGPGFQEVIYQRSLALELPMHKLEFAREVWIDVIYKGSIVGKKRVDSIIEDVMVEIKAKSVLEDVDYVQALSYLKASGFKVGLLLNFGAETLQIRRLATKFFNLTASLFQCLSDSEDVCNFTSFVMGNQRTTCCGNRRGPARDAAKTLT